MNDKKRPVLLVTVWHTGTRSFLKLVEPVLGEPKKLHEDGHRFYHHHARQRLRPRYEELLDKGYDLIVTSRNREDVRQSWERRYADRPDLLRDVWEEQWNMYHNFLLPRATLLFDYSLPNRESSLADLNTYLGTNLTTDWEPIGSVR